MRNQENVHARMALSSALEDIHKQCFMPAICTVSRPPREALPKISPWVDRSVSFQRDVAFPEDFLLPVN